MLSKGSIVEFINESQTGALITRKGDIGEVTHVDEGNELVHIRVLSDNRTYAVHPFRVKELKQGAIWLNFFY